MVGCCFPAIRDCDGVCAEMARKLRLMPNKERSWSHGTVVLTTQH